MRYFAHNVKQQGLYFIKNLRQWRSVLFIPRRCRFATMESIWDDELRGLKAIAGVNSYNIQSLKPGSLHCSRCGHAMSSAVFCTLWPYVAKLVIYLYLSPIIWWLKPQRESHDVSARGFDIFTRVFDFRVLKYLYPDFSLSILLCRIFWTSYWIFSLKFLL